MSSGQRRYFVTGGAALLQNQIGALHAVSRLHVCIAAAAWQYCGAEIQDSVIILTINVSSNRNLSLGGCLTNKKTLNYIDFSDILSKKKSIFINYKHATQIIISGGKWK